MSCRDNPGGAIMPIASPRWICWSCRSSRLVCTRLADRGACGRQIIWFGVTAHPPAEWSAYQLISDREAASPELCCNFNYICVRSFVLYGAPKPSPRTSPNCTSTTGAGLMGFCPSAPMPIRTEVALRTAKPREKPSNFRIAADSSFWFNQTRPSADALPIASMAGKAAGARQPAPKASAETRSNA